MVLIYVLRKVFRKLLPVKLKQITYRAACGLLCLMGTSVSSPSSPESIDSAPRSNRINTYLDQRPLKMSNMIKATRIINDSSSEEKLSLYNSGVVRKICNLIADYGGIDGCRRSELAVPEKKSKTLRKANDSAKTNRGIGYGHGSTKSRWNLERTVEEQLIREECLIWLLNAMTAYIYCAAPDFSSGEISHFIEADNVHLHLDIAKEIGESAIIPLLQYHLNNDSVFDVSEHMDLYQALLETAAAMSIVPNLVQYLVFPHTNGSRSIAKDLILRFAEALATYPNTFKKQMGSPDFRLINFIHKTELYAQVLQDAACAYERKLPTEERSNSENLQRCCMPHSEPSIRHCKSDIENLHLDENVLVGSAYERAMKNFQIQTYPQLIESYVFKKEIRSINAFSSSSRERTKRIAKELATLANTLPLNASNSIFICVDESRCDVLKVLITGPDDTPYQNGLFEFDIFFPTSYPYSPPKCMFLTTALGAVRFNPNLYNDGKICLSILGTWEGRPEEKWSPYCSLLQILISIQGLIFVKEPYFNEPGFEKYQGTAKGDECSRKYNFQIEYANLAYAIKDQLENGPMCFQFLIKRHLWLKRFIIMEQAQKWLEHVSSDEMDGKSKRKDIAQGEARIESSVQEKVLIQLIEELKTMSCPCNQC